MIASQNVTTTCSVMHLILDLLDGPRGENRTSIHDLLIAYDGSSPIVRAIADLTENLTNGEMSWPEYGRHCRTLIAGHTCGGGDGTSQMS